MAKIDSTITLANHNHDGSAIVSGFVNTARLGSGGTAGTTKFLREDGVWAVPAGGGGGGSLTVQEGDSTIDSAVTVLDFDASDFNVTSSPAGEANISLAYGTSAGTPSEGNHTHTAASVTDFAEVVRDTMGVALVAGANITITPNDAADTITIDSTGGGGGGALTVKEGGTVVDATVTVIDFDGTNFNTTESPEDEINVNLNFGTGAGQPAEGNHTHVSTGVTDFAEAVDDRVNALIVAGTNITKSYDDTANTLTINATGGGGGAPSDATYIVQTANAGLSAEQALGALATGILKNTTSTGVLSIAVGADLPTHNHAAADINSGTLATARLGSGTADSNTFLRGDQTWATPAGGGGSGRHPWDVLIINDSGTYRAYGPTFTELSSNAALHTLFDAVKAVNKHIHFATGAFTATSALLLLDSMTVTGDGWNTAITRTGSGGLFRIIGTSGTQLFNCVIRNIRMIGPSIVGTQVAGSGVQIDWGTRCEVSECFVAGFGSGSDEGGIAANQGGTGHLFRGNMCWNNKNGICLGNAGDVALVITDARLIANHCYSNWDDGLHSQRCGQILYLGNTAYNNGPSTGTGSAADGAGIDVLGDEGDTIMNNICYGNDRGLECGNTAVATRPDQGHTFAGNVAFNNARYGFTIIASTENSIWVGNVSRNNGNDGFRIGTTTSAGPVNDITLSSNLVTGHGTRGIDVFGYVNRAAIGPGNRCESNSTCDIGFRMSVGTPSLYLAFDNMLGSTTKISDTAAQAAPTRDSNGNITY